MALSIRHLLVAMADERKKVRHDEDDDFVLVQQVNNQWPVLFETYFLSPSTRLAQTSTSATSDDDLVFYVTRKIESDSKHPVHLVEVFRHHDIKRRPHLGSPDYDWEETTNLNLVLHQFEYTVTTAVYIKTSDNRLQILKRLSTRVYASPSRRDMESKGTEEKITYPNIYFTVDNFEDKFCEMVVNEGQMLCVELVARNPVLDEFKVLFLGSVKYEVLRKVYETRATTGNRVAQRMSLGMYNKRRVEFVRMRGPHSKGHAEVAVSRYRSMQSGITTPESTPTTPMKSHVDDEDWKRGNAIGDDAHSQKHVASIATTPEVQSTDIRQEFNDNPGGFLGRRFSQAMNWVKGSTLLVDSPDQRLPLQTCLTYLTLPCQIIVSDILASAAAPTLPLQ